MGKIYEIPYKLYTEFYFSIYYSIYFYIPALEFDSGIHMRCNYRNTADICGNETYGVQTKKN